LELTVSLTKDGRRQIHRFAVGPGTRQLKGVNAEEGRLKEVLDIDPRPGHRLVERLLMQSSETSSTGIGQGDFRGLWFAPTGPRGDVNIQLSKHLSYAWSVLGRQEAGWVPVVTGSDVVDGIVQLTVQCSRPGMPSFERVFRVVPDERPRGLTAPSFRIVPVGRMLGAEQTRRQLGELMVGRELTRATKLFGHLGRTGSRGRLPLPLPNGQSYVWRTPGAEAGWDVTLVNTRAASHGWLELTVRFERGNQRRDETLFLGPRRAVFSTEGSPRSRTDLWELRKDPATGVLGDLVATPPDVDWPAQHVERLVGLTFAPTQSTGVCWLVPWPSYQYQWSALGFQEAGWVGQVVEAGIVRGLPVLTVEFTREDVDEAVRRTFRIGPDFRTIEGRSSQEGQTRQAWKIEPIQGPDDVKYLKQPGRVVWDHEEIGKITDFVDDAPSPEALVISQAAVDRVIRIVNNLENGDRRIALKILEMLTDEQIAQQEECSIERVRRVRRMLQEQTRFLLGDSDEIEREEP
jgi:hypothetical protein